MTPDQRPRDLTRADFERAPAEVLRQGVINKPDLLVYQLGDEQILLKDHTSKGRLWRGIVGALLTWREWRALRALVGLRGVPQLRGRPNRYSVAMTYIPGRRARRSELPPGSAEAFVQELERIVRGMHARGVLHLDMKHRCNVMVSADGLPVVLDFESAVCFSPRWFGGRLAVKLFGRLDWLAVQNWKRRLCPEALTAAEARSARRMRRLRGWWLPNTIVAAVVDAIKRRRPKPPEAESN